MTTLAQAAHATPRPLEASRRHRATAVLAAILTPIVIWLAAVPLLGNVLQVAQPGGRAPIEVGVFSVVVMALTVALAGWGVLAVLERLTRRARTIWTATAAVVLVASIAPLLSSGTSAATRVVLILMHLAVAGILIPALPRGASTNAVA